MKQARYTREEALARKILRNKANLRAGGDLKGGRATRRALAAIKRRKERD